MRKGFYWKLAAGNIRKNRKIYYPYLLTAVLTAMMLYVISSLSSNQSLGSGNLLITLQLGKLVTTLFAVIFLFYTNSFLMKRRKKEFGLLNILGMGKKHIALVIFCETLILLLVSLVLGIGKTKKRLRRLHESWKRNRRAGNALPESRPKKPHAPLICGKRRCLSFGWVALKRSIKPFCGNILTG